MNRDFSEAKHGTLQLGSIWYNYLRFSLSLACVTLLFRKEKNTSLRALPCKIPGLAEAGEEQADW